PRSLDGDAANVMRQALAGMLWTKQFYNYDVDRSLSERGAEPFNAQQTPARAVEAGGESVQSEAHAAAAQRPVAPHAQRRHHLDAGQVGIPVVRGVGPRVPRGAAHPGRRGLRQAPARLDRAAPLPAPERTDSALRVDLRRRQPAGARMVDDVHLPAGEDAARQG